MRIPELWRTTTFRLATLYGVVFAVGVLTLLGLVYWRTTSALTLRVDDIVESEASALSQVRADALPGRIASETADGRYHLNTYGLFSRDGARIAGGVAALAPTLRIDAGPQDVSPAQGFRSYARALAVRLPWGEVLVVGRDVSQIRQLRGFILGALVWSGALIAAFGLGSGVALSIGPLRRLRDLQAASHRIIDGDLRVRMPIAGRRDELDLFAGMVNGMVEEVERLLGEMKAGNDAVAHDLRTPLAHVRAGLHGLQTKGGLSPDQDVVVAQAIADLDLTLERFAALLRVSELEASARRAGFRAVPLATVLGQVIELYEPVADARGVTLEWALGADAQVEADEKLLVEAVSNLVDNAIKFSAPGGVVRLELTVSEDGAQIAVRDQGPGIAPDEREAVLQRFRRGVDAGRTAGSGLGLSIVAAIARLHRCELELHDNRPGLRAVLRWRAPIRHPAPSILLRAHVR